MYWKRIKTFLLGDVSAINNIWAFPLLTSGAIFMSALIRKLFYSILGVYCSQMAWQINFTYTSKQRVIVCQSQSSRSLIYCRCPPGGKSYQRSLAAQSSMHHRRWWKSFDNKAYVWISASENFHTIHRRQAQGGVWHEFAQNWFSPKLQKFPKPRSSWKAYVNRIFLPEARKYEIHSEKVNFHPSVKDPRSSLYDESKAKSYLNWFLYLPQERFADEEWLISCFPSQPAKWNTCLLTFE